MKVNYTVLSKAKTILKFQQMAENICILPKTSELNFKESSPNGLQIYLFACMFSLLSYCYS